MSIPVEIERKFLVRSDLWPVSSLPDHILQGYFSPEDGPSVRVRLSKGRGRMTIKQTSRDPGQGRAEFEYDIPAEHAEFLLRQMCPRPPIEKLRHRISFAGFDWVIDEFLGDNNGLVLAEIELKHSHSRFAVPIWTAQDVTTDHRFRNSYLFHHPWRDWELDDRQPMLL